MAQPESPKRPARHLRAPSQTVRERAEKAQIAIDKPVRPNRVRNGRQKVTRPLRALAKPFHRQPFIFIGRIIVPRYFRDAWKELRLVVWPNRKQSRQLTTAVLGFAIVFGALIALVDFGLDKVFKAVLLK